MSVLAAFIFVSVLGWTAVAIENLTPREKTSAQSASATLALENGTGASTQPRTAPTPTAPAGAAKDPCKPGHAYKISASTRDLKVNVKDDITQCYEFASWAVSTGWTCDGPPGDNKCYRKLASAAPLCNADGGVKPNKCRIYTCLDKKMLKDPKDKECTLLGDFDPDKAEKIFGCEKLDKKCIQALDKNEINSQPLTDLLKTADPKKIDIASMPDAQQREILKAFQDEKAAESGKILSQAAAGKTAEAQINEFVKKNCANDASNDCLAQIDAQTAQKAGLECREMGVGSGVSTGKCSVKAGDALRQIALNKDLADQVKLEAKALPPGTPGSLCPSGTGVFPNCGTTGCTGANCGPGSGGGTGGNGTTGFDKAASGLSSLLGGLAKGLTTPPAPPAAPAQACATDPNAYAQQQQQYQQQLQQYNYQLQQQQYQQQMNQLYAERNGGSAPPTQPPPAQPTPCTPSTGNQCREQPQQPPAGACSAGSWRATYSGVCVTGWQCISTEGPKAELSCEPKVADVGMTLAITYGCSSGTASSTSFKVTTQPGGSATTTIVAPPAGTNTATYTLACTDNGKTTGAQCSVQVSRTNIILVANPKTVPANGTSLLSWLTTGMQSCIISSPDQADFTARNSSNTSVTGAATTSAIASSARFLLHCETLSGATKDATTTIQVQ